MNIRNSNEMRDLIKAVHNDEIDSVGAKENLYNKIVKSLCLWNSKFRVFLLLLILVFSGIVMGFVKADAAKNSQIQAGIARDIIRFHVIANSDSNEDQNLKLKVKEKIVSEISPYLREATSITEARNILFDMLPTIQEIAEEVIEEEGFYYPISVSLEECNFPLKVYSDYTFPPGTYEALRVKIGDAQGKNWWCVLFPPLCFVDETYSIVDEKSEEQLKYLLTEEEFDTLKSQKAPVRIKFKLWEEIKAYFDL